MNDYRHYIRINEKNEVIKAFSTAFEEPDPGDILIRETDDRHFVLEVFTEDELGNPVYKNIFEKDKIREKTPVELVPTPEERQEREIQIKAAEIRERMPRLMAEGKTLAEIEKIFKESLGERQRKSS